MVDAAGPVTQGPARWPVTASSAGLVAVVWWISFVGPDVGSVTWADAIVCSTASLGILLRERSPLAALLLCTGCDLAASLLGLQGFGYHFAAWVAVYAFSVRHTMPWALAWTLPTMGAVIVAETAEKDWRWFAFGTSLVAGGALVALAFGQVIRLREELLVSLRERAESAEHSRESEAAARIAGDRLRIAREVHDVVAHRMAIIHLRAAVSLRTDDDLSPAGRRALREIDEAATAALGDIDQLLADLRAGDSSAVPVVAGLDLDDLVSEFRDHGLDVVLTGGGVSTALAPPTVEVVRRAALEGLTNGLKHGAGAPVRIALDAAGGQLTLTVRNRSDDGAAELRSGWGLRGVRERVEEAGGRVWFGPEGGDFVLGVRVPIGGGQ
ncbi:sensor histidine kinase [Nocardioides nitrophenolicus]|uniref:sensor histidine kinase n=1 Tax=Nocardioides nitrophenolicus TaxID=60489 RepID=UPI00195B213E|nr:histidine kinase [Nocardioides nitrophenolicus]MBM7519371.1 signal transduction histidine kinase [Nocardioides nitrophenolicus]